MAKKKEVKEEPCMEEARELSDKELEQVSGGKEQVVGVPSASEGLFFTLKHEETK